MEIKNGELYGRICRITTWLCGCDTHCNQISCFKVPFNSNLKFKFQLFNQIKGYTLLEVMVALIIIGISITAVTGGLSGAKNLSVKADQSIEAVRILNNLRNNPIFIDKVIENDEIEEMMQNEEGWQCKAVSESLVINAADMLHGDNIDNREKENDGETIEVPEMREIKICITDKQDIIEKEYCITIWKRKS